MALLFGITAAAATLLYRAQGAWGVITLILPALIIQASLVALSRSTQAVERARERERAAREREAIALARETEALRVAAGAAEEEREQIAADIHDGAVQDLAGLLFTTRALDARLAAGDPPTPDEWTRYLEHCRDVGSIATRELQSMVVELDPPLLAERGLSAALAQLLSGLDPAIVCHLDCAHDPSEPGQQRLIYRAVREAYRNILKHAKCKNVWVEVGANGDRLVASVRDDGRGFSPEERARRQAQGHNGLGLLERTAAAQGCQITLSSAPGVGTTLSLSLPLLSRERGEQTAPASAP
jgi:signal transduction histidine kinase